MFKLTLPEGAILEVKAPDDTVTILVHRGGGEFLSTAPIRALAGAEPFGGALDFVGKEVSAPLDWETDGGKSLTYPFTILFDVKGAYEQLRQASIAGDAVATDFLLGAKRNGG